MNQSSAMNGGLSTTSIEKRIEEYRTAKMVMWGMLREAYAPLDIKKYEKMVDRLYARPEDVVELAWECGIIFEYEETPKEEAEEEKDPVNEKSRTLIRRAYYSIGDGKIHVVLKDSAINAIENNEKKEEFKKELLRVLTHEDTHRQQDQGKNREQRYVSEEEEGLEKYLSQKFEIDAFARTVGRGLVDAGVEVETLINHLPPRPEKDNVFAQEIYKDKMKKLASKYRLDPLSIIILSKYYLIEGNVWRRFLKRLYEYMITCS